MSWRISRSVKVNGLSGPWPMLLYTWLIPHCDNLGRFHGEPSEVRGHVLPKQRATDAQVEKWLGELAEAGLIEWYEVEGLKYIAIPAEVWGREQRLNGNMSRASDFPPCTNGVRTVHVRCTKNVSHEGEGEGEVEGEENTCPPDGERVGGAPSANGHGKASLKDEWLQAFTEDFYPDYPRKVKPDAARRAWLAIKPWSQETCDRIFTGLDKWKAYWAERETEKRFIPHPASFLNSGQWKGGPQ